MALSAQDRIEINDLINLHGHFVDTGLLHRLSELFTADITYDMAELGHGVLHGVAAIDTGARALGNANPLGHHVTNIVITGTDEHTARVQSKGIGIMADGTTNSVGYQDTVVRARDGWKISYRKITAGRALGGAHGVLERLRQVALARSSTELNLLYADDAVHEFPFTAPGLPSRLVGRDDIVDWTVALWKTGTFTYERYRTLAVHQTNDPDTIIVEQEAIGTSTSTGEFTLPNIMVLTARNGQIAYVRDYVNVLAAQSAVGEDYSR